MSDRFDFDETMSKKKIVLSKQNNIKQLEIQVDEVIRALGHPEALVTDESTVYDFLSFIDKEEANKELDRAEEILGMAIDEDDTIVLLAKKLLEMKED